MGILNNTVSLCQFTVAGTLPKDNSTVWIAAALAKNGFKSIETTSEELSIGWVELNDFQQSGFNGAHTFEHQHYYAFSLRRDQRKLPTAVVKPYIQKAEEDWLAVNPKFKRVPKAQREDLRDAVRASLLSKTLPIPSIFDVVWDIKNNLVSFSSLSSGAVDLFMEEFRKSFDGLRLVPLHPIARAAQVIDPALQPALAEANQSSSDTVLEQIEANPWLGCDFLFWLMHETMNGTSDYAINQPGPGVAGDSFTAYLNDRLVLAISNENGVQKVTVAGPQDHFNEVRTALQGGKSILEAVLYLEQREQIWKLTLKGGTFYFASFKAPAVTLEKDDTTDPDAEREAVFY
ncbi:MAG: recombination-associated protein RdgC, partial [Desulfuromonadales bacterium]|nr:recombination-associated protein RdgC [Desulfuromonadales bacterium]